MATLKETMLGSAAPQNNTAAAARLLQAKAGNLAGAGSGGGGPRQESALEDAAVAEAGVAKQQQGQQIGQALQGQAQQQEAQAQQAGQAQQALASQEKQKLIMASNQASEILTTLEQGKATLGMAEQTALAESAATALRLGTEKYVAQIQDVAARNRITDMASAQEALLNQQMDDMMVTFSSGINSKQLMQMDDQAFRRELAKLNISDAKKLAELQMHRASEAQKYGAISGAIGAGGTLASKAVG